MHAVQKYGSCLAFGNIASELKSRANLVEQLASVQRGTIYFRKGGFAASGEPMDQPRVDVLAGAALAYQQHGDIRPRDLSREHVEGVHVGSLPIDKGGVRDVSKGLIRHLCRSFPPLR